MVADTGTVEVQTGRGKRVSTEAKSGPSEGTAGGGVRQFLLDLGGQTATGLTRNGCRIGTSRVAPKPPASRQGRVRGDHWRWRGLLLRTGPIPSLKWGRWRSWETWQDVAHPPRVDACRTRQAAGQQAAGGRQRAVAASGPSSSSRGMTTCCRTSRPCRWSSSQRLRGRRAPGRSATSFSVPMATAFPVAGGIWSLTENPRRLARPVDVGRQHPHHLIRAQAPQPGYQITHPLTHHDDVGKSGREARSGAIPFGDLVQPAVPSRRMEPTCNWARSWVLNSPTRCKPGCRQVPARPWSRRGQTGVMDTTSACAGNRTGRQ